MKSYPTLYNGTEFRSRLEARWAGFFDKIGWKHTFEPFDCRNYQPDFVVHGRRPLLVEVKPAVTLGQYRAPVDKLLRGLHNHWTGDVAIFGVDPLPMLGTGRLYPPAGLLGRRIERIGAATVSALPRREDFAAGYWCTCRSCGEFAIRDLAGDNAPCGHKGSYPTHPDTLRIFWAQATNLVKWHALSSTAQTVGEEVSYRSDRYPAT